MITVDIVGLLVHTRPQQAPAVRKRLEKWPGVEVHMVAPDGRLVVTVESCDEPGIARTLDRIGAIVGIQSTALVYHHTELLVNEPTANKECKP